MLKSVQRGFRSGVVTAPSSKSYLHRFLLAAFLSPGSHTISYSGRSDDVSATVQCLQNLGREFRMEKDKYFVSDSADRTMQTLLPCQESGTTLRLLLPVVCALGMDVTFSRTHSLALRPLQELLICLRQHGITFQEVGDDIHCSGRLTAGTFRIPGNISSQYISGLLFALPLLEGDSSIECTTTLVSKGYLQLTEDVLQMSGIAWERTWNGYRIPGRQTYQLPDFVRAEGDWSAAAPFLCMGACSPKGILVRNLNINSLQGDRDILTILSKFGAKIVPGDNSVTVQRGYCRCVSADATIHPDLIPALVMLSLLGNGESTFFHMGYLRGKESDRFQAVLDLLDCLSADYAVDGDVLSVSGGQHGDYGSITSSKDHRILMAAVITATADLCDVFLDHAESVNKSYPDFWNDFEKLEVTK